MEQNFNPYSDSRFVGYVTLVAPGATNVHFPSSLLLKRFYNADEGFHALTGEYIIIEGSGIGFLGKITEISLPEKERLALTETKFEKEAFHPFGKVEILLCFNNYELKAQKGLEQLPPVGSKVYLCSNEFLGSLLTDFGKKKGQNEKLIPLAHLPKDESHLINVSAQALFGRHCAIVGTTGGGKSWTVAKLIQEVIEHQGKAVLIDATGEYSTFKSKKEVSYLRFNSDIKEEGIHFDYRNLRETDIYALFRPTGQAQIPKLQEAMKSLRLVEIITSKLLKTHNDIHIQKPENGFWDIKESQNLTLLKKVSQPRNSITKAYKENISVFDLSCNFDIMALPFQIIYECVRDFGDSGNYGTADQTAQGFCQSLISRILVTLNSQSFKNVFGFTDDSKSDNDFVTKVNEFLDPASDQSVLIISVADIPTEHKLREILVNAIGRFLLEKALDKGFKTTDSVQPKKSLLVFLDEAHLFLNKKIKDEYSIEVDLVLS